MATQTGRANRLSGTSPKIDQLILDELRGLLDIPDFTIARRWHGIYPKHPTKHLLVIDANPHCKIATVSGGVGMTLSFGFAETLWDKN